MQSNRRKRIGKTFIGVIVVALVVAISLVGLVGCSGGGDTPAPAPTTPPADNKPAPKPNDNKKPADENKKPEETKPIGPVIKDEVVPVPPAVANFEEMKANAGYSAYFFLNKKILREKRFIADDINWTLTPNAMEDIGIDKIDVRYNYTKDGKFGYIHDLYTDKVAISDLLNDDKTINITPSANKLRIEMSKSDYDMNKAVGKAFLAKYKNITAGDDDLIFTEISDEFSAAPSPATNIASFIDIKSKYGKSLFTVLNQYYQQDILDKVVVSSDKKLENMKNIVWYDFKYTDGLAGASVGFEYVEGATITYYMVEVEFKTSVDGRHILRYKPDARFREISRAQSSTAMMVDEYYDLSHAIITKMGGVADEKDRCYLSYHKDVVNDRIEFALLQVTVDGIYSYKGNVIAGTPQEMIDYINGSTPENKQFVVTSNKTQVGLFVGAVNEKSTDAGVLQHKVVVTYVNGEKEARYEFVVNRGNNDELIAAINEGKYTAARDVSELTFEEVTFNKSSKDVK